MAQNSHRQYFYLVVINYDESTYPQKIFLQEHEAITWGRREATKALKRGDSMYEYVLFKQEIARTSTLTRVKTLEPYKETVKSSVKSLEEFDWGQYKDIPMGSDYDIDLRRV